MRNLLEQLETAVGARLYYVSLITALTVPEIAGALDSDDGKGTGERYRAWYDRWVRPRFGEAVMRRLPGRSGDPIKANDNPLDGEACYLFRCSLLHQGSSQHPKSAFNRILFIEPGASRSVHHYGNIAGALCIDLPSFCSEVIDGTRLWLEEVENTDRFRANYARFARRHPNGLAPYIGGVSVIG